MTFRELGISAPFGFETPEFVVRPIRASDAQLDYDAVMESKESLRKWNQSTWPEDDFTVEANREDMVTMEQRHIDGYAFGYTVMNPDQTESLGCVYVFSQTSKWLSPAEATAIGADQWADCDAVFLFWVRESRLAQGLDRSLLDEMLDWIKRDWNLGAPVVMANEQFDQQVAMIEEAGLQRRFEVELPDEPGTYLAYA
jgi:hypothetical protein